MDTFGKRLTECRKAQNLSQKDLAEAFVTSHTTIGKYERDEMTPSIDTAKKLAGFLNTSVGYLLGETENDNLLKDPKMMERLTEIGGFSQEEQQQVLFTLDAVIREIKNRKTYS